MKHFECSISLDFENVLSEEDAIAEFLDYCRNDANFEAVEVKEVPTTKTYEVSVSNFFDAESPKDAVKQMITWLIDNAWVAGYRVNREYTNDYINDDLRAPDTWFIDAEEMGQTS